MAAVDRAGLPGLLVNEQVEGVAHQLHLVQGLTDGHGAGRVELLAHDHRGVAQLGLHRHPALGGGVGGVLDGGVVGVGDLGLGHRCRGGLLRAQDHGVAVVVLDAVARAAQALGQLAHGDVHGGVAVRGAGLGPDDRALGDDGDLDALGGVGLARVALVGDLDLHALDAGVELLDLGGLLLDVVAQARADLGVATDDGDVHDGPSFL